MNKRDGNFNKRVKGWKNGAHWKDLMIRKIESPQHCMN